MQCLAVETHGSKDFWNYNYIFKLKTNYRRQFNNSGMINISPQGKPSFTLCLLIHSPMFCVNYIAGKKKTGFQYISHLYSIEPSM